MRLKLISYRSLTLQLEESFKKKGKYLFRWEVGRSVTGIYQYFYFGVIRLVYFKILKKEVFSVFKLAKSDFYRCVILNIIQLCTIHAEYKEAISPLHILSS